MPTCPMYQLGNFVWYAVLQKCVRHVRERVWGGGGLRWLWVDMASRGLGV